jgi:hypothetical protein
MRKVYKCKCDGSMTLGKAQKSKEFKFELNKHDRTHDVTAGIRCSTHDITTDVAMLQDLQEILGLIENVTT